jgi:hypothetical protein
MKVIMKRQKIVLSDKKRRKLSAAYRDGGGNSKYARKRAFCLKNGVWGWEVPTPKPWNKKVETAG